MCRGQPRKLYSLIIGPNAFMRVTKSITSKPSEFYITLLGSYYFTDIFFILSNVTGKLPYYVTTAEVVYTHTRIIVIKRYGVNTTD